MDKMKIIEEAHPHFCMMRKAKITIWIVLAIMSLPVIWTLACLGQGNYPDMSVFIVAIIVFVLCAPISLIAARLYDKHDFVVKKIIEKHLIEEGKITQGEEQ